MNKLIEPVPNSISLEEASKWLDSVKTSAKQSLTTAIDEAKASIAKLRLATIHEVILNTL